MPRSLGRIATVHVSDDTGVTWSEFGCAVDLSLDGESETIDDTCRGDGAFRHFLSSYFTGSIPYSARNVEEDAGQLIVKTAFFGQSEIMVRFRPYGASTGADEFIGTAIVPGWSASPDIGGPNDINGSFQLIDDFSPTAQP